MDASITSTRNGERATPRRWRVWLATWLVIAAIAGVIGWGSDRVPADPNAVLVFDGTPELSELNEPVIRIGTFNIHGTKGPDGVRNLQRSAETIRGLDIVALQEVHGHPISRQDDDATEVGRVLGMASLFIPTERRWWGNNFGNGLLSRVEMTPVHRVPLPGTQKKRYRSALLTSIRHRGRRVNILAVHLDNLADHDVQLRAICDLFLTIEQPAILIGDLNTGAHDERLKALLAHPEVTCAVGEEWPDRPVMRGVDWIIARGLRCVDRECRDLGASDHAAVHATLELLPALPRPYVTAEVTNVERSR